MPTILVAEDDEGMRDFVTEVLRNGGFRVLTARDGAEGIELAEQGDLQIDCVLTDQVMPGASGCELAQRARLRWTKVPVLVISGYRIDEDHFSRQLGSRIAFLRKPFTPSELLAHIGSLLA